MKHFKDLNLKHNCQKFNTYNKLTMIYNTIKVDLLPKRTLLIPEWRKFNTR